MTIAVKELPGLGGSIAPLQMDTTWFTTEEEFREANDAVESSFLDEIFQELRKKGEIIVDWGCAGARMMTRIENA